MNERLIKLLLVEDETGYAYLLRAVLSHVSSTKFEITHAKDMKETLNCLRKQPIDVVLLDLSLPDQKGIATYTDVRQAAPTLPVIVLTGLDDESLALAAMREGAQDYLVKGQADGKMLARVVRYAIERKAAQEAFRQRQHLFQAISENAQDYIAVVDPQGRRVYNSPSYQKLLGNRDGLLGTDSFEEIHPEDREGVRRVFQSTLESREGSRTEYRLQLKDGSVRHLESQGSVVCDEQGNVSQVVVVSRDITQRVESARTLQSTLTELKQSRNELAKVIGDRDESASSILRQMDQAVQRADALIGQPSA